MDRKFVNVAVVMALLVVASSNVYSLRLGSPKFSDWAPVVHLPPPINSAFDDQAPVLSRDEKTLFFTSNRPGSLGSSEDIWVSTRKTKNSPWRRPENLGALNTPSIERLRSITSDGRVMLFMSDRFGTAGQTDIWATVRENPNDDFGWSEPVNLGPYINSESSELAARYLFANGGRTRKLLFTSSRLGGLGGPDFYESTIGPDGFESAINIFELNTPSVETCFWVRDDGLELVFISNRPELTGDLSKNEVWATTRDSVDEPWSAPVKLGPEVNAEGYQDVNPSLSFDGRTLLLASRRPGGIGSGTFDIYMTTRRRTNE
jgi:hypothetical protein